MTDNEIIKALEYCSNPDNTCEKCVLYATGDDSCECASKLRIEVVNLINRQKADLLRLQNKVGMLEIEKQAIKEDSDKSKVFAMGVIQRQDEKISRLRENNEAIMQTIADVREACEKAHDEAVKDFAYFLIDKAKDGCIQINDLPDLVVEWSREVMQNEMCGK